MRAGMAPLSIERQCVAGTKSYASYTSPTQGLSKKDQSAVCRVVLSSPLRSRKLLKSQSFDRPVSRAQLIKRSCSAILDESLDRHNTEGSSIEHSFEMHKSSSVASEARRSLGKCRTESHTHNSFVPSKFDFLEPMMLGIRPEPPEWPEREAVLRTIIEQKANSCDLPFSLRMIKKKQQISVDSKGGYSGCCSLKRAISSMVFILVELQSHALHKRGVLCDEDLEIVMGKVQTEMHSSYLWLFQQVFSVTPDLMIHVMTLLSDYSVHSVSDGIVNPEPVKVGSCVESAEGQNKTQISSPGPASTPFTENNPDIVKELSQIGNREWRNIGEMSLWNSILVEAAELQSSTRDVVLDHDTIINFVSPINVELEPDDSSKFHRTDLLYQLGLTQEPNNPLLLCNYAQFLHCVIRDYDRAEECYKRAIQVAPVDGECLCQYANFLWTIRKDFWCAEERFLEALATEPSNPFYASRYANFLWSTGGEDTCYPLDSPSTENRSCDL